MEPWGLEPYDDHVMRTAESQLASAYMQMMRVPASIWSCGGDTVIIPDSVVPGLDGISWGKTCKGGRGVPVEDFRKGLGSGFGENTIFILINVVC